MKQIDLESTAASTSEEEEDDDNLSTLNHPAAAGACMGIPGSESDSLVVVDSSIVANSMADSSVACSREHFDFSDFTRDWAPIPCKANSDDVYHPTDGTAS
jgi:hypothetical protein